MFFLWALWWCTNSFPSSSAFGGFLKQNIPAPIWFLAWRDLLFFGRPRLYTVLADLIRGNFLSSLLKFTILIKSFFLTLWFKYITLSCLLPCAVALLSIHCTRKFSSILSMLRRRPAPLRLLPILLFSISLDCTLRTRSLTFFLLSLLSFLMRLVMSFCLSVRQLISSLRSSNWSLVHRFFFPSRCFSLLAISSFSFLSCSARAVSTIFSASNIASFFWFIACKTVSDFSATWSTSMPSSAISFLDLFAVSHARNTRLSHSVSRLFKMSCTCSLSKRLLVDFWFGGDACISSNTNSKSTSSDFRITHSSPFSHFNIYTHNP